MTPYEQTVLDTFDTLRQEHEARGFALARTSPLFTDLVYTRLLENGTLRPSDTEADIESIMGKLREAGYL